MANKTKRPACSYSSGVAYFLCRCLPAAICNNLHYIATATFFVYILGISGGADIRYMPDTAILARITIGWIVWVAVLAVYFIARNARRKEKNKWKKRQND